MPLVSVVVPNYNHAQFLEQRLDSILQQTFQDFDLLVLDDGSSDESLDIIERYHRKDSRIKTHVNRENTGNVFLQWNKGIEQVFGRYIWIAESDDWADPEFLEELVPVLEREPGLGLAYSKSVIVNQDGKRTGESDWMNELHPERWRGDFIAAGTSECCEYLVLGNTIPNASAVLFRKDLFDEIGGADPSYRFAADWKLWAQMLLRSDLAYSARPLNFNRRHRRSVMATLVNDEQHFLEYHRVRFWLREQVVVSTEVTDRLYRDLADVFLRYVGKGGLKEGVGRGFHCWARVMESISVSKIRFLTALFWRMLVYVQRRPLNT